MAARIASKSGRSANRFCQRALPPPTSGARPPPGGAAGSVSRTPPRDQHHQERPQPQHQRSRPERRPEQHEVAIAPHQDGLDLGVAAPRRHLVAHQTAQVARRVSAVGMSSMDSFWQTSSGYRWNMGPRRRASWPDRAGARPGADAGAASRAIAGQRPRCERSAPSSRALSSPPATPEPQPAVGQRHQAAQRHERGPEEDQPRPGVPVDPHGPGLGERSRSRAARPAPHRRRRARGNADPTSVVVWPPAGKKRRSARQRCRPPRRPRAPR